MSTDEGPCAFPDHGYYKCAAGWSAWVWARQGDYIVATFKNWSHNRARNATIRVYGRTWPKVHTVAEGESLVSIAQATYGKPDWVKIYNANKSVLPDYDVLWVGTKLSLPSPLL